MTRTTTATDITVRVTKKDILTGSYISNTNCALAKALHRSGFKDVHVTPSYVRIGKQYYDLPAADNDELVLQDDNKDINWPVKGMVITLTAS